MTVRRPYWSLLSPGTDFGGYYVPIMDPEQKMHRSEERDLELHPVFTGVFRVAYLAGIEPATF